MEEISKSFHSVMTNFSSCNSKREQGKHKKLIQTFLVETKVAFPPNALLRRRNVCEDPRTELVLLQTWPVSCLSVNGARKTDPDFIHDLSLSGLLVCWPTRLLERKHAVDLTVVDFDGQRPNFQNHRVSQIFKSANRLTANKTFVDSTTSWKLHQLVHISDCLLTKSVFVRRAASSFTGETLEMDKFGQMPNPTVALCATTDVKFKPTD